MAVVRVATLLPLRAAVEQTRRLAAELHETRVAVLRGVQARLQESKRRRAVSVLIGVVVLLVTVVYHPPRLVRGLTYRSISRHHTAVSSSSCARPS